MSSQIKPDRTKPIYELSHFIQKIIYLYEINWDTAYSRVFYMIIKLKPGFYVMTMSKEDSLKFLKLIKSGNAILSFKPHKILNKNLVEYEGIINE